MHTASAPKLVQRTTRRAVTRRKLLKQHLRRDFQRRADLPYQRIGKGVIPGVRVLGVCKLHILFAEVELQFDKGGKVEQLGAKFVQLVAESATHLTQSELMGSRRGGCNKVGHSFGLT